MHLYIFKMKIRYMLYDILASKTSHYHPMSLVISYRNTATTLQIF